MKRWALLAPCVLVVLAGCAPSVDDLRTQAVAAFQTGHLDRAQNTLDQILARRPTDAVSLYYMGRVMMANGRYGMAMYYFQCALDSEPSLTQARTWLDRAQAQMGPAGPTLRIIPPP